jgi:hypothetical protein
VDVRQHVVAVAASNKHSAALTSGGELLTFGANAAGQLGYGTASSGNNPTPRLVESMKVRGCVAAAPRRGCLPSRCTTADWLPCVTLPASTASRPPPHAPAPFALVHPAALRARFCVPCVARPPGQAPGGGFGVKGAHRGAHG